MSFEVQFRPDRSALHGSAGLHARSLSGPHLAQETNVIAANVLGRALLPLARNKSRNEVVGGATKRAMDIVVALMALLAAAPVMLLIAALIRVSMGRKVIFSHERVGADGSLFTCYKFRSMPMDADAVLKRHLAVNPEAAWEWRETRKLRNDPRVSCLGNVLRKTSLDELPQLINVLRGDMSLIGPRPIVPAELLYYGEHASACFSARPGLTGLWQVSGRNHLGYDRRVALDRYYARRWSIWLDCWILLKTFPALLSFDKTS